MQLKYFLGSILSIPLLPFMYFQGKKIRASVPQLPEAIEPAGQIHYPNAKEENFNLVCIGESTMAGVGVATHREGFAGTLANELSTQLGKSISWSVYAKSGYTVRKMVEKLLPLIKEKTVNLIVISVGGNDAFTLNTPSNWMKHNQLLIEKLKKRYPLAPIVFCNMPPIKEFPAFTRLIKWVVGNLVEILGEGLKKLVRTYDHVYYNSEIITISTWQNKIALDEKELSFFSDGVHPSALTYQTWAKEMSIFIHEKIFSPKLK